MKIFIVTMDDPVFTIPFFKEVIGRRDKDIVGVAVASGDRLKLFKNRSKTKYVFSLLLIMGIFNFTKNSATTVFFKIRNIFSKKLKFIESPSILTYARKKDLKTYNIDSPNNTSFLEELKKIQPDVIINQSQHILKNDFLSIPKIGVINRHNALLPRNRGRLTPFWVLYNEEKETGVSIHFIDEEIDSGDIIVQERFEILPKDSFNSIVRKNYKIAGKAMLKALDILESGNYVLIKNDRNHATYNFPPTLSEAISFRIKMIKRCFKRVFSR
jgi:folate-dependent phosphoribosylglycinamide formyltransferase PurN